jgi:hypothetical protein
MSKKKSDGEVCITYCGGHSIEQFMDEYIDRRGKIGRDTQSEMLASIIDYLAKSDPEIQGIVEASKKAQIASAEEFARRFSQPASVPLKADLPFLPPFRLDVEEGILSPKRDTVPCHLGSQFPRWIDSFSSNIEQGGSICRDHRVPPIAEFVAWACGSGHSHDDWTYRCATWGWNFRPRVTGELDVVMPFRLTGRSCQWHKNGGDVSMWVITDVCVDKWVPPESGTGEMTPEEVARVPTDAKLLYSTVSSLAKNGPPPQGDFFANFSPCGTYLRINVEENFSYTIYAAVTVALRANEHAAIGAGLVAGNDFFWCALQADCQLLEKPRLVVRPNQYDFGEVSLGAISRRSFNLFNPGSKATKIDNLRVSGEGFRLRTDYPGRPCGDTPITIEPNTLCNVSVRFEPTAIEYYFEYLTIDSNAVDGPHISIPLVGTCVQSDLVASPSDLNFGQVFVGKNKTLTVSLVNKGETALEIANIHIIGGPAFTLDEQGGAFPCGSTPTIRPGATCTFSIRFNPTSARPYSRTLTIRSRHIPVQTTMVIMRGIGITCGGEIQVSPTEFDFGNVEVGKWDVRSVSILNAGTTRLKAKISGILDAYDEFELSTDWYIPKKVMCPPCSSIAPTIEPQHRCCIYVYFRPRRVGAKWAFIMIRSDDPNSPRVDVNIKGRGIG